MLSEIAEKRIDDISTISDELKYIVPHYGWTDYACSLFSRLQRLAIILDDDGEDAENQIDVMLSGERSDDEEKGSSGGGHGNTKIPFGLCQREGIEIGPNWTPRDAWDALADKGYSASDIYDKLQENGEIGGYGSLSADIVHALRPPENGAIFFSGCAQKDDNGKSVKKSPEVAEEFAKNHSGVTMGMLLEDKNIHDWDWENSDVVKDWSEMSKVYAKQASGDVRVIARQPMRKGNIFENVEFPTLKRNKKVNSVTMIDPDTGEEKVLFRRESRNESGKNNGKMGLHERSV